MTTPLLKNCPFCGGDASCSPCDGSGEIAYAVACLSCEAQITKCDEAGAIEQWNTRTPPLSSPEQITMLRGALETCAKTFRRYGELHRAKGTTEGNLKASNNDDLAEFCEGVLADCATPSPMSSDEQIERVARAMYERGGYSWDAHASEQEKHEHLEDAKAAIEVLFPVVDYQGQKEGVR